ncbi:MAG: ornithine--oxo-acid transaminase [Deltaproteobacteria bacterium]|nr:ornithine--oxo-acid transaminase [Deltaproteobacteria bacterium]
MKSSADYIQLSEKFSAHNYAPLDVVISEGKGSWVTDVEGKRYLDLLSGYSALNFGHCNPRLEEAAIKQLKKLTLTSRAFHNDQFSLFCSEFAELCGMESVVLMNSGAEAVETAVKIARRWGYRRKGIAAGKAEIIAFSGNFHGRTTTIISFSDSDSSREDFGPFTPGFKVTPYGDLNKVKAAITSETAAVLIEPVQGEGGVIFPPDGFLRDLRALCTERNVLMIADEIQSAFFRTGTLFACHHEKVHPDMVIVGKSLGGGIVPISAVASSREIMEVLTPGSHGSTFGGNPFACAIAREVINLLKEKGLGDRVKGLGAHFEKALREIAAKSSKVDGIRARGLFFGFDIKPSEGKAKKICIELKNLGVLAKDTREQTIRFAPPLTVTREELDYGIERIRQVLV